jgi:hypothetical protein
MHVSDVTPHVDEVTLLVGEVIGNVRPQTSEEDFSTTEEAMCPSYASSTAGDGKE